MYIVIRKALFEGGKKMMVQVLCTYICTWVFFISFQDSANN